MMYCKNYPVICCPNCGGELLTLDCGTEFIFKCKECSNSFILPKLRIMEYDDIFRNFKTGDVVKHFKGKEYVIVNPCVKDCSNSGNGKEYVLYRPLLGKEELFIREKSEFMSKVDLKKYPNATQKYRFKRKDDFICERRI